MDNVSRLRRIQKSPDFCPVQAALRILSRARVLLKSAHCPIAVHQVNCRTAYVTGSAAQGFIRSLAVSVYNVSAKKAHDWTCHSVRIGACVMYHIYGFNSHELKWELRWRGESFMDYLQDVPALALKKTRAFNQVNPDAFDW